MRFRTQWHTKKRAARRQPPIEIRTISSCRCGSRGGRCRDAGTHAGHYGDLLCDNCRDGSGRGSYRCHSRIIAECTDDCRYREHGPYVLADTHYAAKDLLARQVSLGFNDLPYEHPVVVGKRQDRQRCDDCSRSVGSEPDVFSPSLPQPVPSWERARRRGREDC